ncbi:MAG TPA: NAD-dependent epimerase/dehydratase family protein [Aggregatilinea sp.]|uniref:NAD-dependent epimerase/dehydratase family protein n=1 Tax=Aggregatilinea sp. TaxID=2806333 RepID=UPI002B755C6D|nr:NAD-dependent epimerase/dehydratase family protein [Aggregatilinea sp.]HML21710.1 NAD-dependent epimerase/dehydratase family protein [Aggregatilinea sp.]
MRVLVIGGTRFIGPPIVDRLHAQGHEIMLLHRTPGIGATLPSGITHVYGDRRADWADLAPRLRAFGPDVVLDMIALGEADAQQVMETFKGAAGRVVAISSQDVYLAYGRINGTEPGDSVRIPFDEDDALREKLYPYRGETPRAADDPMRWADDYDKILVERRVMGDPDLPGTVLRLPMVYGPGDYQHRLFPYLKRMDDGRPAILLSETAADWHWTRAYVENVAEAVMLAITDPRAAGRIYNVGDQPLLSMAAWVRTIGQAAGWQGEIEVVANDLLPEDMRDDALAQDLVAETTRIRRELGYREVVPLETAMARTVEWERAHPPAQVNPADFDYEAEDAVLERIRSSE